MAWFAMLLLIISLKVGEQTSPIPLEQGSVWIYEGSVSWTVVNSTVVKSDRLRWITRVVESYEIPGGHVALVSGFPIDLAWYEPGQSPKLSLLILDGNKLFHLEMESEHAAHEAIDRMRKGSTHDYEGTEPLLDLPLAKSKRWANDPNRNDDMYCWLVTEESQQTPQVSGYRPSSDSKLYTIIYATLPDDQTLQIVPGLGIVRYAYRHHGTVAHTDVSLVAFQTIISVQ